MTKREFDQLPYLMFEKDVMAVTGYSRNTLAKMLDCGVLAAIKPPGAGQRRFRKRQIAMLLGLEVNTADFAREALLIPEGMVEVYTGLSSKALTKLAASGVLTPVRPAGSGAAKFRKAEIATLIGFPELV